MNLKTQLLVLALTAFSFIAYSQDEDPITQAEDLKKTFIGLDESMQKVFEEAHGYILFHTIGKGAYILGGAGGKGVLYEKGEQIGFVKLTQVTIGAAIGGQVYSQVIFFENEAALKRLKSSKLEMSAQVSAVAATAGVAATAPYVDGVKIFTHVKGGLMAEASAGGQKLKYKANK